MTTPIKGVRKKKVAARDAAALDPAKAGAEASEEVDMSAPVLIGDMPFAAPGTKAAVKPSDTDLSPLGWEGCNPGTEEGALAALEFLQTAQELILTHDLSERSFTVYLKRTLPAGSPSAAMLGKAAGWTDFAQRIQARYLRVLTPGVMVGLFMALKHEPGETAAEFIQRAMRLERHLKPVQSLTDSFMVQVVCKRFTDDWAKRNQACMAQLHSCACLEELDEKLGTLVAQRAANDTVQPRPSPKTSVEKESKPRGGRKHDRPPVCWECGQAGHMKFECPRHPAGTPGSAGQGGASGGRQ
jgi:hypothetical protein